MSQKAQLKVFFEMRPKQWIPLWQILDLRIAQYGTRIKELRDDGMRIENRVARIIDGQKQTEFMYIPKGDYQQEMFA